MEEADLGREDSSQHTTLTPQVLLQVLKIPGVVNVHADTADM
jgi:hypothetical protein